MTHPTIPCCPRCLSIDITSDSVSRFNFAAQRWEQSTLLDGYTCENCGKDFEKPEPCSLNIAENAERANWLRAERVRDAAPDLLAAAKAALIIYRHPLQVDDPTRAALAQAILKAEG